MWMREREEKRKGAHTKFAMARSKPSCKKIHHTRSTSIFILDGDFTMWLLRDLDICQADVCAVETFLVVQVVGCAAGVAIM